LAWNALFPSVILFRISSSIELPLFTADPSYIALIGTNSKFSQYHILHRLTRHTWHAPSGQELCIT